MRAQPEKGRGATVTSSIGNAKLIATTEEIPQYSEKNLTTTIQADHYNLGCTNLGFANLGCASANESTLFRECLPALTAASPGLPRYHLSRGALPSPRHRRGPVRLGTFPQAKNVACGVFSPSEKLLAGEE